MKFSFLFILALSFVCVSAQSYKELQIEYQKGEFEYVIAQGVPLCKENHDNINLKLLVGRAYTDNMQYNQALEYLNYVDQNAKKKGWRRGWCEIYLGICNFGIGKYEWSRTYLNSAAETGSTDNIRKFAKEQLSILGFTKKYRDFRLKVSEEILFHFHPDISENIDAIDKYIKEKEKTFKTAKEFFNCTVPKKIDLFVWESDQELQKHFEKNKSGYIKPELCLVHSNINSLTDPNLALVVSHFVKQAVRKTAIINYGTAKYLSYSDKNIFEDAKKAVIEKGVSSISIKDIWAVNNTKSELFNIISAAFVQYLIEKEGKEKFLKLFNNQTLYHAKQVYGDEINKLISDFEAKLFTS